MLDFNLEVQSVHVSAANGKNMTLEFEADKDDIISQLRADLEDSDVFEKFGLTEHDCILHFGETKICDEIDLDTIFKEKFVDEENCIALLDRDKFIEAIGKDYIFKYFNVGGP